jgi:hypothetical protein
VPTALGHVVAFTWAITAHLRATADPSCSNVGLDADPVIHRVLKALLTAQIPLSRLDGDVAEQKLDLVQFPSGIAAEAGTGAAEIMWRQILNGCSFGAVLHDVPHNPFRYTIAPSLARTASAPKHATFTQSCGRKPRVNAVFEPIRYENRPNMPGLANQINDRPVIIPALKMSNLH